LEGRATRPEAVAASLLAIHFRAPSRYVADSVYLSTVGEVMHTPPPELIQDLRDRIRGIEGVRDRGPLEAGQSTGFPGLDRLLAGRGLKSGTLVEWRGDGDASGSLTTALAIAGRLVRDDGALVVIDAGRDFYPVGAAGLGVPLERTIVVRTDDPAGASWAWEQSLRAPGVAVTLGRLKDVNDRVARRLQLAAEAGGGFGFLVRPPDAKAATWATTRIVVEGVVGSGHGPLWRLRVRVTRGQVGPREAIGEIELGDEADPLPVAAELAGPVAKRRPTRLRKARGRR
jgi:protein ImuA